MQKLLIRKERGNNTEINHVPVGVRVIESFPEKGAFMLNLEERNASQSRGWWQGIPNMHTPEVIF